MSDRAPISRSLRTVPTHMICEKQVPQWGDRYFFWLANRMDELAGRRDLDDLP
jgi:hypothetical protein